MGHMLHYGAKTFLLFILSAILHPAIEAATPVPTSYSYTPPTWSVPAASVPPQPASQQPGYTSWSEANLTSGAALREPYVWMVHPDDREAGIAMPGNAARLRAAWHRLIHEGQNLTVVFIGGSVTEGWKYKTEGMTFPDWAQTILKAELPEFASRMTFLNRGFGAITSSVLNSCHNTYVPRHTDIIVSEFAINDPNEENGVGTFEHNPFRHVFERLLRSLLQYPKRPAIVMMNTFRYSDIFKKERTSVWPWWTGERDFWELSSYYRLASLSFKAAVMHNVEQGAYGYRVDDARLEHPTGKLGDNGRPLTEYHLDEGNKGMVLFADAGHSDGNTGFRVMGELVAQVLLNAAASVQAVPLTAHEVQKVMGPIPPPAFLHNWESAHDRCLVGQMFSRVVTAGPEWNHTDEGRRKWGYVSVTPGSMLTIKIDNRLTVGRQAEVATEQVVIQLAYLCSYDPIMGAAAITCESGCVCQPSILNGHHQEPTSLKLLHDIVATQHENCVIKVVVQPGPPNAVNATKVKIMGIMWSDSMKTHNIGSETPHLKFATNFEEAGGWIGAKMGD